MKTSAKLAASGLVALLLTGCASSSHQTAQQQLGQQSVLAVNWFQQSGEYQALTGRHLIPRVWRLIRPPR